MSHRPAPLLVTACPLGRPTFVTRCYVVPRQTRTAIDDNFLTRRLRNRAARAYCLHIAAFPRCGGEGEEPSSMTVISDVDYVAHPDPRLPCSAAVRVGEIGRASCRDRVGKYVLISVVGGSLKNKNKESRQLE